MNKNKKLFYLSMFATFFAVIVVGLGAYTRLVHAGLGCPDWPGCYGFLTVPDTAEEIAEAEAEFPHAPVEVAKGWAEMIHRYVAGTLMLLVLSICVVCFKKRHDNDIPIRLSLFILGLICLQAAFGMWTVTLKLWPQVVTAHLLGGFATLCLLFLLTLRLYGVNWEKIKQAVIPTRFTKSLAAAALLLVIAQVTLGGWTSSNYAALACPDLPTCQGQWIPEMDMGSGFNIGQSIGPNYLGGKIDSEARTAIHFTHRIGAIVVSAFLIVLFFSVLRFGQTQPPHTQKHLRWLAGGMLVALIIQVALGLSNIIWHLPLWVAVAHNLGGALVLLSLIALNFRLNTAGREPL